MKTFIALVLAITCTLLSGAIEDLTVMKNLSESLMICSMVLYITSFVCIIFEIDKHIKK